MFGGHGFGWGGGWMWFFWLLIVIFVVVGSQGWARGGSDRRRSKSALEILDARYARGEIDRNEYEQKRSDMVRGEDDA
jgi:putative membrane protein